MLIEKFGYMALLTEATSFVLLSEINSYQSFTIPTQCLFGICILHYSLFQGVAQARNTFYLTVGYVFYTLEYGDLTKKR